MNANLGTKKNKISDHPWSSLSAASLSEPNLDRSVRQLHIGLEHVHIKLGRNRFNLDKEKISLTDLKIKKIVGHKMFFCFF